jgi:hypothetical protein
MWPCHFTLKSILRQKKNYKNPNTYFTMQKYNFQKNPLKETKMMKPCQTCIRKIHPRKGEKKKQWARTKVPASKQPKRGRPSRGKGTT